MNTVRFVAAVVVAASFMVACGDSSDDQAATTDSAPINVYSADEFNRRVLESPPKGISIHFEIAAGDEMGIESATVEAEIATLPDPAARIRMRLIGKAEVLIETIITGEDLYFRGGVGDELGDWLRTSEEGGAVIAGGLPGGDLQPFSYEDLNGREWSYLGDEDCAVGRCFVVQSIDDEAAKLHLQMTDYKPVRLQQPSISGFGDEGLTIDVIGWDVEVDVQPPTDNVRDVTAQELGASMIGLIFALGLGG